MIDCRGFQTEEQAKQFAHLAKFLQGMRNQGIISHGLGNFAHPANQIRIPSENKPTLAKLIHTPKPISHTVRNPKGYAK